MDWTRNKLFPFFLPKESPVHGSITRGDTILSLYGCQVYNKQDWNSCISKTLSSPQHGYCTDMLTIARKNSSKGINIFKYCSCSSWDEHGGSLPSPLHPSSIPLGILMVLFTLEWRGIHGTKNWEKSSGRGELTGLNVCLAVLMVVNIFFCWLKIFTTNSRSERGSVMCRVHQVVRPW